MGSNAATSTLAMWPAPQSFRSSRPGRLNMNPPTQFCQALATGTFFEIVFNLLELPHTWTLLWIVSRFIPFRACVPKYAGLLPSECRVDAKLPQLSSHILSSRKVISCNVGTDSQPSVLFWYQGCSFRARLARSQFCPASAQTSGL